MRPAVVVWAVVAIFLLLLGCGDSGESHSTDAVFAVIEAQERKLQRLQRQLRMRRQEIREARGAAASRQAEFSPAQRSAGPGETQQDFSLLERRLPGRVGATIGPPGRRPSLRVGRLASGAAWSTIKVPIALAVLREANGPTGLRPFQAADIRAALIASDNEAAAALFAGLERRHGGMTNAAEAVMAVIHESGDSTTRVSTRGRDGFSPYGQTMWSLPLQHLFMSRLAAGCLREPRSSHYVLRLMGEVSSDTWGIGSAGPPARWKGGWGPGIDGRYLVRQMGLFEVGGRQAIVTLAAVPDDGSFTTAQSMATSVARWLAGRAARFSGPTGRC